MMKIVKPEPVGFRLCDLTTFPDPRATYAYVTSGNLIAVLTLCYNDDSDECVAFRYSDDLDNDVRKRTGYDSEVRLGPHQKRIAEAARNSISIAMASGREVLRFETRAEFYKWASQNVGH